MIGDGSSGIHRVPSGLAGLDTILSGGFLRGGLYIVQGAPGTGKTTLGNQICFNHAAAGGQALYATLLAEYHGRMLEHLSGMSFVDLSQIPDRIRYVGGFGALRQNGYAGLRDLLRREITLHAATVMILDGFATTQRKEFGEQNFNEFVHELQAVAIAINCTMFLLSSALRTQETPEYSIVDGILELNDQMVGWSSERTLQVLKLRGTAHLRGRHAFRITSDGFVVYPRVEALLAKPTRSAGDSVETVSSGVGRLDAMLGKGLPAASTTMIMGPAGAGKTTLGMQFLSQCGPNSPGLFLGFHETPVRLGVKADEVCRPLRALLDSGGVEIIWQPSTGGLIDAYGDCLLKVVRERGIRRLFIDGLGAFQNAATEPARMAYYLAALLNELKALEVTTICTLEVADIKGPYVRSPISCVSVLADNLIIMRYVERDARLHRLISILKVRDSDFDHSLYGYVTTEEGLRIEETFGDATAALPGDIGQEADAVSQDQDSGPGQ